MLFRKEWKHTATGIDGNCILFGVNIFDYDWKNIGEKAIITDPQYHQKHTFNVYTVNINGTTKMFAAGEFSNCVWGFYVKKIVFECQ